MTRHLIDDYGHTTQTAIVDEWAAQHLPLTSVALAAAVPVIEAEVRERIAREIEALADDWADWDALVKTNGQLHELRRVVAAAVHDAAAIARGTQ